MKIEVPQCGPVEQAFWAAIVDNPEDALARMAYADWLDDQDRAKHAEFIRQQHAESFKTMICRLRQEGYSTEAIINIGRDEIANQVAWRASWEFDKQQAMDVLEELSEFGLR